MRFTRPWLAQLPNTSSRFIHHAIHRLDGGFDFLSFGRLIQHCTEHGFVRQAKQLHARLVVFSISLDNFLSSKFITFYSKWDHLNEAHKVFDQIPHRNTFSWNALLIGYSCHNRYIETLQLFSTFLSSSTSGPPDSTSVKPDGFTMTCVTKALSSLFPNLYLANMIHSYVFQNGFDSDIFVVNALITYYSRCDDMVSSRTLFDSILDRDIVSWNSMIAGYSQGGFYNQCKRLFKEMLSLKNLQPDRCTIGSVLQACAQSNDLVLGMEIHQFVIDNNIKVDLTIFNSTIALYAKCGSLDYARELFKEVSEKDVITYGAMISGYMVHGFVDEAMKLFRELENPGLSTWNAVISGYVQNNQHDVVVELFREMQDGGFRPNMVTLSSILPILVHNSNLKGAKEIHAYAVRNNYDKNLYVSTAIIDTYAKLGFLKGAQSVFERSESRSVVIWTAIISAYAAHGDAAAAIKLYNDMLQSGKMPDPVTFAAALSACAHSGKVEEAWEIFNSMSYYDISPMVEHYACMVGVLSRAGKLSEAVEFVSTMPLEPSGKVWGALLNGAYIASDVELGKFACDHLFEIEPENTGNYVTMANLYSKAGKWEDAERIRNKMKNIGLQKIAGRSWIETSEGLQSFIARDGTSKHSEEIYQMLEGLLELMREEGYTFTEEFDEETV